MPLAILLRGAIRGTRISVRSLSQLYLHKCAYYLSVYITPIFFQVVKAGEKLILFYITGTTFC